MITRFAPSPTGPLHLGHAYSALTAFRLARELQGTFLLRIDDIDRDRSRPEWERLIFDDLHWLGLTWPEPVLRQSHSVTDFNAAIDVLAHKGFLYPCSCTRADIEAAANAPQEGVPTHGPDGRIYPGTCRGRPMSDQTRGDALRLDMARAVDSLRDMPGFVETGEMHPGSHTLDADTLNTAVGDVVVARRNGGIAYHLSVVVDDRGQNITDVVRGVDLFDATQIHVLLQVLLQLPTPTYHHHKLIRDDHGKRLAKRDDARAIRTYRDNGLSPTDILGLLGL